MGFKMPAGQPTKYTKAKCAEIIEAGKLGMSVPEMASELDVARATLYNWADNHKEFLDAFKRAQDEAEAYWARHLRNGLVKAPAEFQGASSLKYMAQRFDGWSEKSKQEVTSDVKITEVKRTIVRPTD
jgi:AcrR family transcriptional regulator